MLAGNGHTNNKSEWLFSVPTDLTMAYEAGLADSAAMHGSSSATVRVIKT